MFIPLHDGNSLKRIHFQYVTVTLVALNGLIWLMTGTPALMSQEAVRATALTWGFIPAVANGFETLPAQYALLPTPATYVTYAFLHGDFMHMAGNMLFVWVFGDNVEDAMGHFRFLLFYFACAAIAAFTHGFFSPDSTAPLIGASGAAAGIVGAYLLLHPRIRVWVLAIGKFPLRIPAVFVLGAWIAFQFFQLATDTTSNVSWAAHVGGILAGMFLILFFRKKGVGLFDRDLNLAEAAAAAGKSGNTGEAGTSAARTSVPSTGSNDGRKWGRQP